MKTFAVGVLVSWLMTGRVGSIHADYPEEIPFVPTPIEVVDKMLELAEVKKGDVLYDLGSGDGRIVIRAAQKYGIHAVGIEMDKLLRKRQARKEAKAAGVAHLVKIRDEDASKGPNISPASVITLYMLPEFNEKDKTQIAENAKALRPHSRPRLRHRRMGAGRDGEITWLRAQTRRV